MTRNRPLAAALARTILDTGARSEGELVEAIEGFLHDDAVVRFSAEEVEALTGLADPAEINEALDRLSHAFAEGSSERQAAIRRARG